MSEERDAGTAVVRASAVMAAGTAVSRLSGYVRSVLLAAALGNLLHADVFTIANTIPNMLYILLAGGVFNAVLVPQLVRAMKNDPDGGEAYTNRVITVAALFLLTVSALLVLAAPQVMSVLLDADWSAPQLAEQRESVIAFARFCLPQVFFYGMFVLVGQVLNARGRFGPMMWAPIANNVISVLVLVIYLVAYGPVSPQRLCGGFTPGQEALLGLGSTLGIAAQLLILLPYLRAAGFRFRPRFDLRGSGLGHTLRLGLWTVGFVVVNQVAYTTVVKLASSGTAQAALEGCRSAGAADATGYSVYSTAFLIVMVPHSIITVSLATAVLPRLSGQAADGDLAGLGRSLAGTLRSALVVIVPFAFLLPVVATDVANAISFGAARATYTNYITTLALFGPAVVLFTVHYLMLRGFYALERTRTVFFVQVAVAVTNIAVAVAAVALTDPAATAPALVLAYAASYAVGAAVSARLLSRTLRAQGPGGLEGAITLRLMVRLLIASALAAGAAALVAWPVHDLVREPGQAIAVLQGGLVGVVFALVLWRACVAMRVRELTEVVDLVRGRILRRARR